ncbi:hypothetical protein [Legionella rowbothamii]|uniref:hypothetical protein n=1 Tax=Legionella rowbothamii TaxID=96229 RepID=UPI001056927C|nr:hypothetical protein [Legionella rowbothamii]
MGYTNAAFIRDKNNFFSLLRDSKVIRTEIEEEENRVEELEMVDDTARNHHYWELLENQIDLEAEFTQLFAVLLKQKGQDNKEFWMYCYYCASLLESFYKAYSNKAKENEYSNLRVQIRKRILNEEREDTKSKTAFAESLVNNFTGSLRNLTNAPYHTSLLRDYVGYANVCRLYWTFTRLTLVNGLRFAKELQFIEQLDAILGTHTDIDKIISIFQAPNGILNYLSVGFFLTRFMIDAGTLVRHVFFPTDDEYKESTMGQRLKYELYKLHWAFGNDLTWAGVNFLTNFNHITNIPGPVAGAITAVFLGFDVCMTLYQSYLFKQEYLVKKAQYSLELEYYQNYNSLAYKRDLTSNERLQRANTLKKELQELEVGSSYIADLTSNERLQRANTLKKELQELEMGWSYIADLTSDERLQHANILTKQLQELEVDWKTKEGKLYFAASAASLLMLGFSSTLIFSPPGIIIASYFACTVAIAMYLSTGNYGKYQEKSLRLPYAELYNTGLELAQKEFDAARSDFIFTMAKNVIIPSVLIATFALYWPAAVAFTVAYLGYELLHAQDQHARNEEIQELSFSM